ncbi:MAG TPA: aldehyde dehydrogenase family protein, partial [Stellaceae bacterium]|nr:aldehyde dehydrogenase family protein [Stellaceae bacterium]
WMFPLALACGNSFVLKPSERDPSAALFMARLLGEAGLPAGVFNVVQGDKVVVDALLTHPDVKAVSFVGSTPIANYIYETGAKHGKRVQALGGAKNHMVVMPDADLDKAVDGAVIGMRFTRQGQSCTASSRIFVQDAIHDAFVAKLKAKVDAMKMGDPLEEGTDIGTIISQQQFDKVKSYIAFGEKAAGAVAHRCSALPRNKELERGFYVQPVIFTGISNDHKLAREEIFGPVTCVIKFKEYEDAIRQANDSDFGLAATIWTRDLKTALDATQRLEAGLVQVNQNLVVQANMSYGGIKQSGLGKEASLESMLEHFTQKKTIIINLN